MISGLQRSWRVETALTTNAALRRESGREKERQWGRNHFFLAPRFISNLLLGRFGCSVRFAFRSGYEYSLSTEYYRVVSTEY